MSEEEGGYTPLLLAVEAGHLSCVRCLVDIGANVNPRGTYEHPLYSAALEGHFDIANLLLDAGAVVDAIQGPHYPYQVSPMQAIHAAASNGETAVVRSLIEAGADADVRQVGGPEDGMTPLQHAMDGGNQETHTLLTTVIARCEALQIAARNGDEDDLKRLIHQHTNMVHGGVHAADVARAHGHKDLANWMYDLWQSVSRSNGYKRYNALQAHRSRYLILRQRFTQPGPQSNFAAAALGPQERVLLDWLLVGTSIVCPDDVFSVVVGYWRA